MVIDVAARRLQTQRLVGAPFASAVDTVAGLGAVQAQDYAGAKWALGLRTHDLTEAALDRLFDAGTILRTHVMRPTWHFVLPADVRWLLDLTAPRVKAILAPYDRRLEIDPPLLRRSHAILEAALRDGLSLTRDELAAELARAGIPAAGQRLGHLLMHAELDAIMTSGPRRGKQQTYALLAERAPRARRLDRDEALAELTRRYFAGHGPAQAQDFAWWSGLSLAEVKRGLALVGSTLVPEVIGGKSYWGVSDAPATELLAPIVHLLPNFDEFLVGYRDRAAALDPDRDFNVAALRNGSILSHVVILNGQVCGGWKRRLQARQAIVELGPLVVLDLAEGAALRQAVERLARFLGVPTTVA